MTGQHHASLFHPGEPRPKSQDCIRQHHPQMFIHFITDTTKQYHTWRFCCFTFVVVDFYVSDLFELVVGINFAIVTSTVPIVGNSMLQLLVL